MHTLLQHDHKILNLCVFRVSKIWLKYVILAQIIAVLLNYQKKKKEKKKKSYDPQILELTQPTGV